jgi:hypothetical protein
MKYTQSFRIEKMDFLCLQEMQCDVNHPTLPRHSSGKHE